MLRITDRNVYERARVPTHLSLLCQLRHSGSSDSPAAVSTPSTQLPIPLQIKELRLLGETANSRMGQEIHQMSLKYLVVSGSEEVLKKNPTMMGVFRDTQTN